jgi:hypothetical protein
MRLPKLCSEHFLILLDCGDFHRGIRYFKFENMRLKYESFVDRVKKWTYYRFQDSPSFILARKLKALKADLKVWNEEVFGNIDRQKNILLEELRDLEVVEEEKALSVEERVRLLVTWRGYSHGGGELEANAQSFLTE